MIPHLRTFTLLLVLPCLALSSRLQAEAPERPAELFQSTKLVYEDTFDGSAMRVRYDGKGYQRGFPLLDIGHHIHTLTFSEKATTLTIKKDVEKVPVEAPLFSLNEWHDVVIELKKGTLLVKIDGKKRVFESKNIDMAGQAQIDFKGIDGGTCQIDSIRVWEGS